MPGDLLPEFNLQPHEYGWSAPLPNAPHFFGHQISLDIHTRAFGAKTPDLPSISNSQATLVRTLLPLLSLIVKEVERELAAYAKSNPDFKSLIKNPHIWLDYEEDDGVSWTFVVESTQNPDYGWHAEFRGPEFIELWSGD